jgi:hypothetical protein
VTLARHTQQPRDAMHQRATAGGQHQLRVGAAQLLELHQRLGVRQRVARGAHREIVAAQLALLAHPPRHPPHRGMIEEQRLDRALQQVDQVVVAADVRQLVGQDRLDLGRAQAAQHAGRKQDHGTQPAERGGHRHQDPSAPDAPGARRRCGPPAGSVSLQVVERDVRGRASHAAHQPPAAEQA